KFLQQKDQAARWLLTGTRKVKKVGPDGSTVEVELTLPQRIQLYHDKLAEIQRIQKEEIAPASGTIYQEVAQKRVDVAKAEANQIRNDLRADLNSRNTQMKSALKEVLRPEQLLDYGDIKDPSGSRWKHYDRWRDWTLLDWTDALVVVGLLASGGLLLVGLFSRFACVLGAVLLLMFYLPAMPLWGIPESLRNEGYPFINKNIIEMLALLTLAT